MRQNITTFDHILYKREILKKREELSKGDITKRAFEKWLEKNPGPQQIERNSKII
jgi:hypothetical protein